MLRGYFLLLLVMVAWPAQAEYLIKFSHVVSANTPKGIAADWFADTVNSQLKGKVRVEVFPNSQLYNDNKVLEAMRLSRGDSGIMAAPSLSKFTKFSRQLQLFDLPFLFADVRDVHRLVDSPLVAQMVRPLESKGLQGLSFWDNGMKAFSVRGDRPLRRVPDDFIGKKFRIQSSAVHEKMIEAFGGVPQKLPFKEVYTALSQGVVDGQENSWSNIYSKKFHEVQDHFTLTNHSYLGYLVIVSARFWQNLPADLRQQVSEILQQATALNRREASKADAADRKKVIDSAVPVVTLSDAERATWRVAAATVEKRFEKEIGADLLQKVHRLLDTP